jgi:YVTN family beta-propeller protein
VTSPFSPNLYISADGRELWMTHKDVGKVTVIDAQTFEVRSVIETGPITNHVVLVDLGAEHLAFVTVGGLDQIKVFSRGAQPQLVGTIPTGALPHGIWASDDQTHVYVGLENGDAVVVIDVASRKEITRIPIGQAPQALEYVSNAVTEGDGASHRVSLGESQRPVAVALGGVDRLSSGGLAVVRALGLIDTVDINVFGLEPTHVYLVSLEEGTTYTPLAVVKTSSLGTGAAQVTGPVRRAIASGPAPTATRRIVVTEDLPSAPPLLAGVLGS